MLEVMSEAKETWPTDPEYADRPGATTIDGEGAAFILRPEGNNAARWSAGERLHHLFEERCDRLEALGSLQHPAIELAEGVFSYSELDPERVVLSGPAAIRAGSSGDALCVMGWV